MDKIQLKNFYRVLEIAKSHDGYVISTEFISATTHMKLKCKEGHEWSTRPHCLFYSNTWCPTCYKKVLSERLVATTMKKSKMLAELDRKLCKICNIEKSIDDFPKNKGYRKNGDEFIYRGNKCRECVKKEKNEYIFEYYTDSLWNFFTRKLEFSRKAAKKLNREISINAKDAIELWISQQGKCAISGIPMTSERNRITDASIDRIDSRKGYVLGNIQLVCVAVNYMKRQYDMSEFIEVCRIVAANNPKLSTGDTEKPTRQPKPK